MKPSVKQLKSERDHFQESPEKIPISLEEHMLRKKIIIEAEMEEEKAKAEEKRAIRELER